MSLSPLNDLAKIEIESDEYGFSGNSKKETCESGILVELPKTFHFFGYWSFAFENSFMSEVELKELLDYWKTKIGRKVYWTALAERGNIIQKGKKKYAFVKLTSLIAEDDPDSDAVNIHSDGSGSFGVE